MTTAQEDLSPILPHPNRDLFLWCVLFGKTELAKLLWKNGTNNVGKSILYIKNGDVFQ